MADPDYFSRRAKFLKHHDTTFASTPVLTSTAVSTTYSIGSHDTSVRTYNKDIEAVENYSRYKDQKRLEEIATKIARERHFSKCRKNRLKRRKKKC